MSGDDGLRSPGWSLRAAASARSRTSLEDKEEYLDLRRQDRDGGALQRLSRSPPPDHRARSWTTTVAWSGNCVGLRRRVGSSRTRRSSDLRGGGRSIRISVTTVGGGGEGRICLRGVEIVVDGSHWDVVAEEAWSTTPSSSMLGLRGGLATSETRAAVGRTTTTTAAGRAGKATPTPSLPSSDRGNLSVRNLSRTSVSSARSSPPPSLLIPSGRRVFVWGEDQ